MWRPDIYCRCCPFLSTESPVSRQNHCCKHTQHSLAATKRYSHMSCTSWHEARSGIFLWGRKSFSCRVLLLLNMHHILFDLLNNQKHKVMAPNRNKKVMHRHQKVTCWANLAIIHSMMVLESSSFTRSAVTFVVANNPTSHM